MEEKKIDIDALRSITDNLRDWVSKTGTTMCDDLTRSALKSLERTLTVLGHTGDEASGDKRPYARYTREALGYLLSGFSQAPGYEHMADAVRQEIGRRMRDESESAQTGDQS